MANFYAYLDTTEYLNQWAILPPDVVSSAKVSYPFISASLSASTGIVNGYLSSRYTIPLAVIPYEIKRAVAVLTDYDVVSRRGFLDADTNVVYENRHKDVIRFLNSVKNGELSLDSSPINSSGSLTPNSQATPDQDLGQMYVQNPGTFGSRNQGW